MADISKISSGGVVYNVKDEEARGNNATLFQQQNYLYKGRDLTVVFAKEIANFADAWAWVKNRIRNANFDGIFVGDYIPMTMNGETVQMQVGGIDTYYKTTDQQLGHHIDFISRDCFSPTVQWNLENNNNGTAEEKNPYLASNVCKWIKETLYGYLPDAVKSVITNKRTLMDVRYSESGVLTDSTSWEWKDLGPLWIPTEYEVFGSVVWGTKGFSAGQAIQYPIFANNYLNRIKGVGHGGGRCSWWLASVRSGYSTFACGVSGSGYAGYWNASNTIRVPVCFRIAA